MGVALTTALAFLLACGRVGFAEVDAEVVIPDAPLSPNACIQELALGHDHACARVRSGAIYCWGRGDDGSLGDGGTTDQPSPIVASTAAGAQRLSIGGRHGCAYVNGSLVCWGANTEAQQLVPSGLVATPLVAVGSRHSCVATADGVTCWGCSAYSPGAMNNCMQTMPQFANPIGAVAGLSGKHWHTCAIRASDRSVWCWGKNDHGELGNDTTTSTTTAVRAGTLVDVRQVSTGRFHSCAVVGDRLYTWGDNGDGALGDGTTNDLHAPTEIMSGVVQCSMGGLHACVVTTAGTVQCFGANDRGQLGDGTIIQRGTPMDVLGLPPAIIHVEAGARHTCARTEDEMWCWGRDTHGQLGNGAAVTGDQTMPMRVPLPCT